MILTIASGKPFSSAQMKCHARRRETIRKSFPLYRTISSGAAPLPLEVSAKNSFLGGEGVAPEEIVAYTGKNVRSRDI